MAGNKIKSVGNIIGSLFPLPGAPGRANIPEQGETVIGQNPAIMRSAEEYAERSGIPLRNPTEYKRIDRPFAEMAADYYDRMPHNPNDYRTKQAYDALGKETEAQFEQMLRDGVTPYLFSDKDPYPNSPYQALQDIYENQRLGVFSTRAGFGSDDSFDPTGNPLLQEMDYQIDGQPIFLNDAFRAVHDYYGHGKHGFGFRAGGEENAFQAHSGMFSDLARQAAASETRGQNSLLNYGPFGDTNRTARLEDTVFADQKTGLLPNLISTGRTPISDERRRRIDADGVSGLRGKLEGAINPDGIVEAVHYGNRQFDYLDPSQYGKGLSGRTTSERNMAATPEFYDRTFAGLNTAERPYRKEQGLGPVENTVQLPVEQVYDILADPDNIKGAVGNALDPYSRYTALTKKIYDAGYSAIFQDHPQMGKILSIVDPLKTGKILAAVPLGILGTKAAKVAIGAGLTGAALAPEESQAGLRAFHGSPFKFGRFSTDQIGTGEGNQAYGRGLYFAEREETAQSYEDALSKSGMHYDGVSISDLPLAKRSAIARLSGSVQAQVDGAEAAVAPLAEKMKDELTFYRDLHKQLKQQGADKAEVSRIGEIAQEQEDVLEELQKLDASKIRNNSGAMYEVDLDVTDDDLLNFDAPMNQQPAKIRKAFASIIDPMEADSPGEMRGMDLLRDLSNKKVGDDYQYNDVEAVEALMAAGIKGVKYADAQTRFTNGPKTSNYVIFDDKLITIMRQYGVPLAVAAQMVAPEEAQASPRSVRKAGEVLFDLSRLDEVPDVPQFPLERYDPPRGMPKDLESILTPEAAARMEGYANVGRDKGGLGWYNLDPLRQSFMEELGDDTGTSAFNSFVDKIAATSPRAKVANNIRRASYLDILDRQGQPFAGLRNTDLPEGYGHIAHNTHDASLQDLQNIGSFAAVNRPKTSSFAENLKGNQTPVTADTHNFAALTGDPKNKKSPTKTQYKYIEEFETAIADKLGMTPAQFQASVWMGGETGVADDRPFMAVFDDVVANTAERDGVTKKKALQNFIQGKGVLYDLGPVMLAGGLGANLLANEFGGRESPRSGRTPAEPGAAKEFGAGMLSAVMDYIDGMRATVPYDPYGAMQGTQLYDDVQSGMTTEQSLPREQQATSTYSNPFLRGLLEEEYMQDRQKAGRARSAGNLAGNTALLFSPL